MMMRQTFTWVGVLVFFLFALICPTQSQTPAATVFFAVPLVQLSELTPVYSTAEVDALEATLKGGVAGVLEWRILAEVANQHSPTPASPFHSWAEIWYDGVGSYLALHSALFPKTPVQTLLNLKTTGIGGCRLCPSSSAYMPAAPAWRHGFFVNLQSEADIPLQATFQNTLPLTAAEPGTVDFVMTLGVRSVNSTTILFDFAAQTFFEIYVNGAAFDQHVVNVNNTLEVRGAPNWIGDIGADLADAHWFALRSFSDACYRCESNALWDGDYTNPQTSSGDSSTSSYVIAIAVLAALLTCTLAGLATLIVRSRSTRRPDGAHVALNERLID